jgi:hypothetical protein
MKSKRFTFVVVMVVAVSFLVGMSLTAEAKGNNMRKLVGVHARYTQQLKSDRNFANKRVLFIVNGQKKSVTVNDLLGTVDTALSDSQHSIFVVPLVIAEQQDANYAAVDVSGTLIKKLTLSSYQPEPNRGLAALVLKYEGETTLPQQVMANLETK